jgi:hypothetical protein
MWCRQLALPGIRSLMEEIFEKRLQMIPIDKLMIVLNNAEGLDLAAVPKQCNADGTEIGRPKLLVGFC